MCYWVLRLVYTQLRLPTAKQNTICWRNSLQEELIHFLFTVENEKSHSKAMTSHYFIMSIQVDTH